ncbi:DUF4003 family protein [Solibacillus sp. R5-41]|uniref:DUF4003 family protein n=1 Tax=Solibacillus sp. R5-41 TaxID=2048654 RepID=UPI0012FD4913|nr:DUF4003 family protein [Solibacillus sp. R5-41]
MNERLQLFFDNIEKIKLYFGSDAESFAKHLALKLTVRNIHFYYEDYENVQKQIKKHTKWYQFARNSSKLNHAYYVHFAKNPEQIPKVFQQYRTLPKQFNRGEQSYLTAMYLNDEAAIIKIGALMHELKQQPSLKFSSFATHHCAILATRPEESHILANTYTQYYNKLITDGFVRGNDTIQTALLLTVGTGTFCANTIQHVKELMKLIFSIEPTLKNCHYSTIGLLALANFETNQFPALVDIHDEICRSLKISPNSCNTLLLATQIYTANEAIGDLPSYNMDFSDFAYALVNDDFTSNHGVSDN